jgi:hypothetical protein
MPASGGMAGERGDGVEYFDVSRALVDSKGYASEAPGLVLALRRCPRASITYLNLNRCEIAMADEKKTAQR